LCAAVTVFACEFLNILIDGQPIVKTVIDAVELLCQLGWRKLRVREFAQLFTQIRYPLGDPSEFLAQDVQAFFVDLCNSVLFQRLKAVQLGCQLLAGAHHTLHENVTLRLGDLGGIGDHAGD
jgi:hypothetical protein